MCSNVEQQLIRLGQVYIDGLKPHEEYKREKKRLEEKLFDLVVPGVDSAQEAGRLLEKLPELWERANLTERHRILMIMLDAVYVECKEERRVVAIKPKPAFRPLFEIATTEADSGITLVMNAEKAKAPSEYEDATKTNACFWWRRGRVGCS